MGENERQRRDLVERHAHCTYHGAVRVVLTTSTGVSILVKVGRATGKGERGGMNGAVCLHSTCEGTV